MRILLALALTAAVSCQADETVRAYGAADKEWTLSELDGNTFSATATLTFPETGQIAGNAPCNLYSGTMTVPYPWFEAGPLRVTRRACPDLAEEQRFLTALAAMRQIEVLGDVMILKDGTGREMVFTASE